VLAIRIRCNYTGGFGKAARSAVQGSLKRGAFAEVHGVPYNLDSVDAGDLLEEVLEIWTAAIVHHYDTRKDELVRYHS
jgi:hypothetical protein